jgi:hypothetical protein
MALPPMRTARTLPDAVLLADGCALLIGGDAYGPVDAVEIFDPRPRVLLPLLARQ